MEKTEWKSPRKIEEEIKSYQRERFEFYMERVDAGELEEADALEELRAEFKAMGIVL